jgi:hypothetical protein
MNYDDGPEPGVGFCDVVCAWLLPAVLLLGLFVFSVVYPESSGPTETARSDNAGTVENEVGQFRQDVLSSFANGDAH